MPPVDQQPLDDRPLSTPLSSRLPAEPGARTEILEAHAAALGTGANVYPTPFRALRADCRIPRRPWLLLRTRLSALPLQTENRRHFPAGWRRVVLTLRAIPAPTYTFVPTLTWVTTPPRSRASRPPHPRACTVGPRRAPRARTGVVQPPCAGATRRAATAGMGNAGYAQAAEPCTGGCTPGTTAPTTPPTGWSRADAEHSPLGGGGNATYWGTYMSSITDQTPRGFGRLVEGGGLPAGSAGHVAYVEKVVSPDEIIVSQDFWGGDFSWARITKDSKGWPSGFIHFNDAPLVNVEKPALGGTAKVGAVLTAFARGLEPGRGADAVPLAGRRRPAAGCVGADADRGRGTARSPGEGAGVASKVGYPDRERDLAREPARSCPARHQHVGPCGVRRDRRRRDACRSRAAGEWSPPPTR